VITVAECLDDIKKSIGGGDMADEIIADISAVNQKYLARHCFNANEIEKINHIHRIVQRIFPDKALKGYRLVKLEETKTRKKRAK